LSYVISFYFKIKFLTRLKLLSNTITIKGTMVGILTKEYILHVAYMYQYIKYQKYILNVIYGIGY